jgi:hypothetical protein
MDYIHQVSFVPNLKRLGAGKQVIDKLPAIQNQKYG